MCCLILLSLIAGVDLLCLLCDGKGLIFQSATEVCGFPPFSSSAAFSTSYVYTCS